MSTGLGKYYKLFGLPETATQAEIKRKYRELAMRYHPDKNNGDERKFIEVKEAYEYLTGRKNVVQQPQTHTYSAGRSTSQTRQQPQEDRIKQAQQRYRDNVYKEYIENERYFQKLTSGRKWKVIRLSAIVGSLVVIVLILEQFLPHQYQQERIVAYERHEIGSLKGGSSVKKFYTESGKEFYTENIYSIYHLDPDILLVKSAIFHNEIGIIPFYGYDHRIHKIEYNIGAHSLLLSPFFILPLLIVLFRRKTYTFTLFYFISLYFSAPLIAYFLFTNDRWLHLLTFGYV